MKFNIRETIRQLCDFLDRPLGQDQVRRLQEHLHIDNFRKNKSVNMESNYGQDKKGRFIRKVGLTFLKKKFGKRRVCFLQGSVGGWRGYFSPERVADWKEWVEESTRGTGLEFCLD